MRLRPVRVRRGNYAILFVLTAAVMLSYLAFSIDGGRMKVAYVQVENASEAAGMAALAVIREGGSRGEAFAAAAAAADQVMVIGTSSTSSSRYVVELDWGRWNWDESPAGDNLGVPWTEANSSSQAVTASVRVDGGITSIFAPAIALVQGKNSGKGDEEESTHRFDKVEISSSSRVAFRHRDVVVLVDVARGNEAEQDAINAALSSFVSELDQNAVPGDRLAIMAYAGDTWLYDLTDPSGFDLGADELDGTFSAFEAAFDWYDVDLVRDSARQVADVIEPCYVGSDAWFRWYRHLPSDEDPELSLYPSAGGNFPYWLVGRPLTDSTPDSVLDDYLRLDETDTQDAFLLSLADLWATDAVQPCPHPLETDVVTGEQICPYFLQMARDDAPLDDDELCFALLYSEITFLGFDVRRDRSQATGLRSPLACHDGNWYEDRPDLATYAQNRIAALDCGHTGSARFIEPGVPRYGNVVDDYYHPDRSFFLAGSHTGRALSRAHGMLANRANRSPEATIVLIASNGPNCGPVMESAGYGETNGLACDQSVVDEAAAAVQDIEFDGMNLYVLSLATPGSPGDNVLANWSDINRGYYVNLDASALTAELAAIADDLKIQVVQ